jgi:hypothetical protein
MIDALLQPRELNGPPKYFTSDWQAAWRSVVLLSRLPLTVAGTGHGRPISGARLRFGLHELAQHFWSEAVPRQGRYVGNPAQADSDGVTYVPEPAWNIEHVAVMTLALSIISAVGIYKAVKR